MNKVILLAAVLAGLLSTTSFAAAPLVSTLEAFRVATDKDGKESFAPADQVNPGEVIEYRLTYINKGTAAVSDLAVNGPTIAANSSCTVTVNVTAAAEGIYLNTTTPLSTTNAGSTATGASATLVLKNGMPLSGYVYYDANVNGTLDGSENWTNGTPVFVNLIQGGVVQQSITVAPGNGSYSFPNVTPGNYSVIVSNNATSTTPIAPSGYSFTSPTDGINLVTMTDAPALNYNFGLYNGVSFKGRVFRDSGPMANNGLQDSVSAEPGLSSVKVNLTNCSGTVYASAATNANGDYVLTAPPSVPNGSQVCVEETNLGGYTSTGANVAGTALPSGSATTVAGTSYTYTRGSTPDRIAFTYSTATGNYSNLNFGDVAPNVFTTDNTQSALPGTTVSYSHNYTAQTGGSVVFSTTASASPAVTGWSETIYLDSNCDGQINGGEPQLTGPVTMVAGQTICIIDREFVPATVTTGAQNIVTIKATFNYSNATPSLSADVQTHTDTTIVGDSAALKLVKAVSAGTAFPGAVLTYTVSYTNSSSEPLHDFVINDATPAFTTFISAAAGALPQSLTACTKTTPAGGPVPCAAAQSIGGTGGLAWKFTGVLLPGSAGAVSFDVRVNP